MTTIYLIRHSEAEGNVYRRCHGHYNSLVTPKGDTQIAKLSERFRDIRIDAVYSSDLYRTMKTASAVYKPHNLPLHTDSRLREVAMGIWEDRTFGELQGLPNDELYSFGKNAWEWQVEGSELFPDAITRMTGAVAEIAEQHDGEAVAIVSHGMAIRAFTCGVLGITDAEGLHALPQLDNTAVSVFEYASGEFDMKLFNDVSHLSDEESTLKGQKWVHDDRGRDDSNLVFKEITPGKYIISLENEDCGVLELDIAALAEKNIGIIKQYMLSESFRGEGLGNQLLGQAISVYRTLGRERVRVVLTPEFTRSAAFFERLGFTRVSELELEKVIRVNNSDWET